MERLTREQIRRFAVRSTRSSFRLEFGPMAVTENQFRTLNWVYGVPRHIMDMMSQEVIDEWLNYHMALEFKDRYTPREKAFLSEQYEVECLLAAALGYHYDDDYGWATGDHTIVSLAMEVKGKMVRDR